MERFSEISDSSLNELLENKLSKRSKDCMKWAVQILTDYAISRKQTI